jgi:hypothetical protein
VTPKAALERLEQFIGALPRAVLDDDSQFEQSVLAWVRAMRPEDRGTLFDSLASWLRYAEPAHRIALVVLIGAALHVRSLLDRAIAMALSAPPAGAADSHAVLRLSLVDVASRFPDGGLTAYLKDLATGLSSATSYQDQNAAARATIALCSQGRQSEYQACVAPVLALLRERRASSLDEVAAFASLLERRLINEVVSDHDPSTNGWVFAAIASSLPEGGNRLAEILDSAGFINMATISRAELQHGVRDLTGAGLVGVGRDPFALTETGCRLWEQLWRDYEKAYARTGNGSAIRFAKEAVGPIACAASSPGWSVSQREWDDATAAFHATFARNLRELNERRGR